MTEQQQQALAVPREATTLLADFAAWLRLEIAAGDASQNTVRTYKAQACQFMAWADGEGIAPTQATVDDIRKYRRWLVSKGYARSTIALKLGVVRRLYDAAVWRGLRLDNPAAGIRAPKERTAQADRIKFLPLDGMKRLLAAPQGDGPKVRRDRAIIAMMAVHGLRVMEVVRLLVVDLDLDGGTVRVTGKGDKGRTVYLIPSTVAALTDWLAIREAGEGVSDVFVVVGPNGRGRAMSERAVRYLVDGYLAELGLKAAGVSCHALRHSAATWARAGGAKLDALADMLGHASVNTTRIYAQVVNKITENPARYLAELADI